MGDCDGVEPDFQEVQVGSYHAAFTDASSQGAEPPLKRYLCYFLHRYLEFRIPEIEALAELALGKAVPRHGPHAALR